MAETYGIGYTLAKTTGCPVCGNHSYYEQKTVAKASNGGYLDGKLLICKLCGNSRSFYSKEALSAISFTATSVGENSVDSKMPEDTGYNSNSDVSEFEI